MKKSIYLIWVLLVSLTVNADTVSVVRNYTGEIESFFKRGRDVFSLSGTTTNGNVQKFDLKYPYSGGMVINDAGDMMSSEAIQIATLFLPRYSSSTGYAECWGSGYIMGTIEVKESLKYPLGTPLQLQIDYLTQEVGDISPYFFGKEAGIADQYSNTLWYADHSTNGNIETYEIEIVSGEKYYFEMWQAFGSQYNPVIPQSEYLGVAVALDFSVIPEPTTLSLLALGGLLLRKRK